MDISRPLRLPMLADRLKQDGMVLFNEIDCCILDERIRVKNAFSQRKAAALQQEGF